MRRILARPLFLHFLFLVLLPPALAAPRVLWTVGETNRSGREFGVFGHYGDYPRAFAGAPVFRVGTDAPVAWPYIHPGPADGWAESKRHTLRISFTLDAPPIGEYAVVVQTVGAHASVPPTLEVRVNGAAEAFPMPPGPGDIALSDEGQASPATVRAVFPPNVLRQGANEVALTVVQGSWLLYDSVRLEHDPDRAFRPLANPGLEPTALFRTSGARLDQAVILSAQCYYPGANGTATVRWNANGGNGMLGESVQRVAIPPGSVRIPLWVPEVSAPTTVRVALEAGGQRIDLETMLRPERKWTIYVDPTVHTDIGYTDRQAAVRSLQVENIAAALKRMREGPSFHWNLEIAWQARVFLADRPEMRDEFVRRLREGRIGLHAEPFNMLTGLMSDEEMNRTAYDVEALRREFGVGAPIATLTDVPSATWALPSALAQSGVRYLAQGANQGRSGSLMNTGIKAPFYWEGPDGRRVLTLLNDGYGRAAWLQSGATMDSMERAVSDLARSYTRANYPFDAMYVYGALGDNNAFDKGFASLVSRWNKTWTWPRIVLARGDEFFEHIERRSARSIRTFRGDFGAWWEDGAASSAAETSAVRASQGRITQAETLWSIARLAGHPGRYPLGRFDAAWDNIVLYDEHTWGASQSVTEPDSEQTRDQWAVKASFARKAERATKALREEGLKAAVSRVPARRGDVVVVNTLPWARSGQVTLPRGVPIRARIVDSNGRTVKVQRVGSERIIHADSVPGLGSVVYHVEGRQDAMAFPASFRTGGVVENRFYRVRVEPGRGVVSIIDHATGRELVDASSPYGFGQVVYASGGEGTGIEDLGRTAPRIVMNAGGGGLKPEAGTVLVTRARMTDVAMGETGQLYSEAVLRSEAPSMPRIETRVRLYHNERRISVVVRMRKDDIRRREAVYVAFPFRISNPEIALGMANAWASPQRDFAPGACHEWYSVREGVRLGDPSTGNRYGITWCTPDAPMVTLGDINRGQWLSRPRPASGLVFSYAMNNYWFTNYKAEQGGDFTFRYEISTGPADAGHFALESTAPMLAALSPGVGGTSPHELTVSGNGIALTTLKGAQDGRGYIVRLRNTTGVPATATVALPRGEWQAERCTLVERKTANLPIAAGRVAIRLRPRETATVRILPRR